MLDLPERGRQTFLIRFKLCLNYFHPEQNIEKFTRVATWCPSRGNSVSFGEFGIQSLSRGRMTSNQIEVRVAINRHLKEKFGLEFSLINL